MKTNESVNMARATVDIIVPTYNNPKIFGQMMGSLMRNTSEPFRLIVVNNGTELPPFFNDKRIVLLNSDKNLGWMGGVNAGVQWALKNDPAKFIMWINDDIQILDQDYGWLTRMLHCFHKPGVGLLDLRRTRSWAISLSSIKACPRPSKRPCFPVCVS